MKRLFASVLLSFMAFSCNISDDSDYVHYDFVSISNVVMPEDFIVNELHEITLTYNRPTNCHAFHNIYYNYESDFERTVAIICSVQGNNCEPLADSNYDASFNFKPTTIGTYTFYFWQGEDANSENQYLTVEVQVTE